MVKQWIEVRSGECGGVPLPTFFMEPAGAGAGSGGTGGGWESGPMPCRNSFLYLRIVFSLRPSFAAAVAILYSPVFTLFIISNRFSSKYLTSLL